MSIPSVAPVLLACLHQDPTRLDLAVLERLSTTEWTQLLEYAAFHRVRPLLHRRLNAPDVKRCVPADVLARIADVARRITFRNLRTFGELSALLSEFQAAGIDVALLKGAHLALDVYRDVGLREISDLDLLVRPADLSRAYQLVEARGYLPDKDPDVRLPAKLPRHAPTLRKRGARSVEIHSSITNLDEPYATDAAELWTRTSVIQVIEQPAHVLSAEDLALHVAMHACYQDSFELGLRPFADLSALAGRSGPPLDWDAVVERARRWRWDRGTYLALRLAGELLGGRVPAHVLVALRPHEDEERVLDGAKAAVLSPVSERLCANVARLASDEPLRDRLGHLTRRVFLLDTEVSPAYQQLGRSRRLLERCLRPVRLLRSQGTTAARLAFRKQDVTAQAALRKHQLRRWLRIG